MSNSTPIIDSGSRRSLFGLATAPARLLSRWRTDLGTALAADAMTFSGSARSFFAVLAVVAVAYPLAASVAHAVGVTPFQPDLLKLAVSPFFDVVYSESLPFMIAAVGIGTFCPALGVLFMAVFIPADLIAASRSPVELLELAWQKVGPLPRPYLARIISYGLLWILAVEIPLLARRWATAWAGRGGRAPSASAGAVGRACATAGLVFLWAGALPWLIQPIFAWTAQQEFTPWASAPTWIYWPILVIAAAAIAGVGAVWPRPPSLAAVSSEVGPGRSMSRLLVRQAVCVVVVAALFGGLMTSVREAVILIAGLALAGPVLTVVLPHVPVPAAVARAPRAGRLVAATIIALSVSWVILRLAGKALYEDYFMLVVTLAAVVPLFRFLLEAGAGRARISTLLVLAVSLSLAFPSLAWAHNCPAPGELKACLQAAAFEPGVMVGAALAITFAAFSDPSARPQPPPSSAPEPSRGMGGGRQPGMLR